MKMLQAITLSKSKNYLCHVSHLQELCNGTMGIACDTSIKLGYGNFTTEVVYDTFLFSKLLFSFMILI